MRIAANYLSNASPDVLNELDALFKKQDEAERLRRDPSEIVYWMEEIQRLISREIFAAHHPDTR